ncbi:MAG: hypothetical protein KC777_21785 [Cyanobacteria bacterium HKST-UBA02]|nr:hypothetical protein [Cyanobacteria bacterium HKST-UBA02]
MNAQLHLSPSYDLDSVFCEEDENGCATNTSNVVILNKAIKDLAGGRSALFDPGLAGVPRLYEDEPLVSWLLRASGLVEDQVMIDAIAVAVSTGNTVRNVLIDSGRISHCDMKAAYNAEALVQEGVLYRGFAVLALRHACAGFVEFSHALTVLGLAPQMPFASNKLGLLLNKIGCVSPEHIETARREALSRGITLGWSLVKRNAIEPQLLKVILEGLIAVERGKISEDALVSAAILAVCSAESENFSPEARLVADLDLATTDRALENLLLASGVVAIDDMLFCMEVALVDHKSLESVLESFRIVERNIFEGAVRLAAMLAASEITPRQCTILLERLRTSGEPLSQLLNDMTRDHQALSPDSINTGSINSVQGNLAIAGS